MYNEVAYIIYTLVYIEPLHIQNLRHIQSPGKDLRLSVLFRILCNERVSWYTNESVDNIVDTL